jgi:hemerythrin-like domain-containing protein
VLDAAKARFADYDSPTFNVMRRTQLDAGLRALLPASSREDWMSHANYAQGAKDLRAIHAAMLQNSANVTLALAVLAEGRIAQEQRVATATRAHEIARHVVDHLHAHHHIEDERLFPQFARANPKIERAIALLEADHKVLNAAGSVLDQALRVYPDADAAPAAYDRAAQAAAQLDRVMRRHIADEEDVVIPAYLGLR